VINGERYVSAQARDAVQAAAAQLGYVANKAARDLAAHTPRTVAVIVNDAATRLTRDANTAALILALQTQLAACGYRAVTVLLGAGDDDKSAADFLRSGSADGAILLSGEECPLILQAIGQTKLPAVLLCSPGNSSKNGTDGTDGADSDLVSVAIDDEAAARDVSSQLVLAGRTRIAMIAVGLDREYGRARLRGFTTTLGAGFDARLVIEARGFTYDAGQAAMRELLNRHPGVDGVFIASDVVAAGAVQVLHAAGRRIPEDVGVVAFDGNEWSERCEPALTTVRQPMGELAHTATGTLIAMLAGTPAVSIRLPAETLVRSSV
jgi:DNA-binding LacI/PurR family transcriptional regulator